MRASSSGRENWALARHVGSASHVFPSCRRVRMAGVSPRGTSSATWNSALPRAPGSSRQRVLVDLPSLHDDQEILGRIGDESDVLQRIAVDQEEIRECSDLHDA